ncbi:hypothetical protein N4Q65_27295, partial [Salmonella enterica subsp. enterica serovar Pomona]
ATLRNDVMTSFCGVCPILHRVRLYAYKFLAKSICVQGSTPKKSKKKEGISPLFILMQDRANAAKC